MAARAAEEFAELHASVGLLARCALEQNDDPFADLARKLPAPRLAGTPMSASFPDLFHSPAWDEEAQRRRERLEALQVGTVIEPDPDELDGIELAVRQAEASVEAAFAAGIRAVTADTPEAAAAATSDFAEAYHSAGGLLGNVPGVLRCRRDRSRSGQPDRNRRLLCGGA